MKNFSDFYQRSGGEKTKKLPISWLKVFKADPLALCIGWLNRSSSNESNVSITWNFKAAYRLIGKRKKAWTLKLKTRHEKEFHANFTKSLCPGKARKNWKKRVGKWLWKTNLCRWMCKSELPSLTLFPNTSDSTLTSFPVGAMQGRVEKWFEGGSIKKLSEGYKTLIYVLRMDSTLLSLFLSRSLSHSFFIPISS